MIKVRFGVPFTYCVAVRHLKEPEMALKYVRENWRALIQGDASGCNDPNSIHDDLFEYQNDDNLIDDVITLELTCPHCHSFDYHVMNYRGCSCLMPVEMLCLHCGKYFNYPPGCEVVESPIKTLGVDSQGNICEIKPGQCIAEPLPVTLYSDPLGSIRGLAKSFISLLGDEAKTEEEELHALPRVVLNQYSFLVMVDLLKWYHYADIDDFEKFLRDDFDEPDHRDYYSEFYDDIDNRLIGDQLQEVAIYEVEAECPHCGMLTWHAILAREDNLYLVECGQGWGGYFMKWGCREKFIVELKGVPVILN